MGLNITQPLGINSLLDGYYFGWCPLYSQVMGHLPTPEFLSFSIHSWSLSPVVPPLKVSDTRRKFFSRRKTRPSRSGTRFLCGAVHLGQLCNQATHCHSWPQFLHCLDFLQIFGRVSPRFTITNGNQCLTAKKIHQKRGFAIQSWV